MVVDLHTHTTASDGAVSPEELVKLALTAGLHAIAVTDHDTVGGLAAAEEAAAKLPIKVIPGIEISTDWQDEEIHALGYFIDYNCQKLQKVLDILAEERFQRGKKMVSKLRRIGILISWARVQHLAKEGVVGRPHVAQAMLEEGYVGNISEAFRKYLSKGQVGYVCRMKLTPAEAVKLIRDAGGVPVLAHPGLLRNHHKLGEIISKGFQGIEVYYPQHDSEQVRLYLTLAQQYGLVVTGGSDFHGASRAKNKLAASTVANKVVSDLVKIREETKHGNCK
ncbi:PHP domain-containing protein [Metallumcola ferriviriculae]|uniref:PHP domain-containing protein n=1 Tax=Metallumcola ferriviriculae TaxID=3039180 RepID=A0AAU0UP86_9FIRM|nr:PHP domain-containing protein [Desulfitibacteraceae bacterium MK1]